MYYVYGDYGYSSETLLEAFPRLFDSSKATLGQTSADIVSSRSPRLWMRNTSLITQSIAKITIDYFTLIS